MQYTESKIREKYLSKLPIWSRFAKGKNLWIYGAGRNGKILHAFLKEKGINVSGYIDQKADEIQNVEGLPVRYICDVSPDRDYLLISLATVDYSVISLCMENGFTSEDFYYIFWEDAISRNDYSYKGCKIGRFTYGAESLISNTSVSISIGRFCSINNTARVLANHPTEYVTTHPFLDKAIAWSWEDYDSTERAAYIKKYGKHQVGGEKSLRKNTRVTIGNDVWIGANVLIMPGVQVGNGAIIAGGAVVTHDVEPYAVIGGVPAGVIKYRFSEEEILQFEEIRWWNWSDEKIKENLELFYQPEKFLEAFGK